MNVLAFGARILIKEEEIYSMDWGTASKNPVGGLKLEVLVHIQYVYINTFIYVHSQVFQIC